MFYTLDEKYRLAGWERVPYAIITRKTGRVDSIKAELMQILEMCNGKIDFDLPFFGKDIQNQLKTLEKKGIVHSSPIPKEIKAIQEYRNYNNRYISTAHWSITGACNYKCKHCYLSASDAKYGQLSHEEVIKIAQEIAECGIQKVSITGGEPLIRKDFLDIVDALLESEIYIATIYTNGKLVTRELLKALDERGIHPEFNMSFDGTEGWHNWLRGVENADEEIKKAFLLCREMGFSTGAEMCIHQGNKHTIRDSVNTLAQWGCKSIKINPICNTGAWKVNGYGDGIAYEELNQVYYDYLPHYFEDGRPLILQLSAFFYGYPNGKYFIPAEKNCKDPSKYLTCGHARNVMYISPEGRTLPCMALGSMDIQNKFPSILEQGLASCLTDGYYLNIITTTAEKIIKHNAKCRDCVYQLKCLGGCRAGALLTDSDDIFGIDESICAIFQGGWIEKIHNMVDSYEI